MFKYDHKCIGNKWTQFQSISTPCLNCTYSNKAFKMTAHPSPREREGVIRRTESHLLSRPASVTTSPLDPVWWELPFPSTTRVLLQPAARVPLSRLACDLSCDRALPKDRSRPKMSSTTRWCLLLFLWWICRKCVCFHNNNGAKHQNLTNAPQILTRSCLLCPLPSILQAHWLTHRLTSICSYVTAPELNIIWTSYLVSKGLTWRTTLIIWLRAP